MKRCHSPTTYQEFFGKLEPGFYQLKVSRDPDFDVPEYVLTPLSQYGERVLPKFVDRILGGVLVILLAVTFPIWGPLWCLGCLADFLNL